MRVFQHTQAAAQLRAGHHGNTRAQLEEGAQRKRRTALDELQHRKYVLKRQEQLRKKNNMTRRDWLYILYGSMLLYDPDEEQEDKAERGTESYKKIASTLMVLKGVLEGLRLAPEAVEFYGTNSRPLAAIIARLFDLPLSGYQGPDRPDHALMLIEWAPEIIGPHKSFVPNDKNRSVFSYGLPTAMPLPLIPPT